MVRNVLQLWRLKKKTTRDIEFLRWNGGPSCTKLWPNFDLIDVTDVTTFVAHCGSSRLGEIESRGVTVLWSRWRQRLGSAMAMAVARARLPLRLFQSRLHRFHRLHCLPLVSWKISEKNQRNWHLHWTTSHDFQNTNEQIKPKVEGKKKKHQTSTTSTKKIDTKLLTLCSCSNGTVYGGNFVHCECAKLAKAGGHFPVQPQDNVEIPSYDHAKTRPNKAITCFFFVSYFCGVSLVSLSFKTKFEFSFFSIHHWTEACLQQEPKPRWRQTLRSHVFSGATVTCCHMLSVKRWTLNVL